MGRDLGLLVWWPCEYQRVDILRCVGRKKSVFDLSRKRGKRELRQPGSGRVRCGRRMGRRSLTFCFRSIFLSMACMICRHVAGWAPCLQHSEGAHDRTTSQAIRWCFWAKSTLDADIVWEAVGTASSGQGMKIEMNEATRLFSTPLILTFGRGLGLGAPAQ